MAAPPGPSAAPVADPYTVFNTQQCGGLTEWLPEAYAPRFECERAQRILRRSGAAIERSGEGRARYDPRRDRIALPTKGRFGGPTAYLQTALHELGHWTGDPSRMNRDTLVRGVDDGYGSSRYTREELRAEIASMMAGKRLPIGHDPSRHAHFCAQWVEALRESPGEIDRASRDAQGMCDWLFRLERERPPPARPREGPEAEREQRREHPSKRS